MPPAAVILVFDKGNIAVGVDFTHVVVGRGGQIDLGAQVGAVDGVQKRRVPVHFENVVLVDAPGLVPLVVGDNQQLARVDVALFKRLIGLIAGVERLEALLIGTVQRLVQIGGGEIGRAACRERGWVWGGGGALDAGSVEEM